MRMRIFSDLHSTQNLDVATVNMDDDGSFEDVNPFFWTTWSQHVGSYRPFSATVPNGDLVLQFPPFRITFGDSNNLGPGKMPLTCYIDTSIHPRKSTEIRKFATAVRLLEHVKGVGWEGWCWYVLIAVSMRDQELIGCLEFCSAFRVHLCSWLIWVRCGYCGVSFRFWSRGPHGMVQLTQMATTCKTRMYMITVYNII